MKISAIIPVKTFSKAKTRLKLSLEKKEDLCKLMLEEVLQTVSGSNLIDKILVVSKDENALKLSKHYNPIQIYDELETGVNNAVLLGDDYVKSRGFDASIVFPQDIPFMQHQDIEEFLRFQNSPKSVLVVPSRRFDGTNALFRMPADIMNTHYDEDSYILHLKVGREKTPKTSLVLIRRIMLDIDNPDDLSLFFTQDDKPDLREKILGIIA